MKIGYARTSSVGQENGLQTQIDKLKEAGCERIYSEKQSGRDRGRPELNAMLKSLRPSDTVYICKLDCLARSMSDFFRITDEIKEAQADIVSLDQAVDTSTPHGKLLWGILANLAAFEADLIALRCEEGRERARKLGKHLGRRKSTSDDEDERMRLAYDQGKSYNEIARMFGMSRTSVYRRLQTRIDVKKRPELSPL